MLEVNYYGSIIEISDAEYKKGYKYLFADRSGSVYLSKAPPMQRVHAGYHSAYPQPADNVSWYYKTECKAAGDEYLSAVRRIELHESTHEPVLVWTASYKLEEVK